MKPTVTKRTPTRAELRMRAAASERADQILGQVAADLPADPELAFETIRALIRGAAMLGGQMGGRARVLGVLCGAVADLSPAYRAEKRFTAAEALFRTEGEGE